MSASFLAVILLKAANWVEGGHPMHIFVTGGAGYIGSICSEELLNAGHQVTIFDNLSEGHRAAVDKRATFIKGDLMNRDEIFAAVTGARPDAVMHFAANALVSESMTNPSKYFRNNVSGGINLSTPPSRPG
jgi:UDP-glucose 4-epimerase